MRFKIWLESESFFDYTSIADDLWREKVREAIDKYGIDFDTENDEAVSEREIIIPQSRWDFTKCKFKCEMHKAGGDWQTSVCYFRCQLVSGYASGCSQYSDPFFCVIPGKNDGNQHLVKTKKGWIAPDSDNKEKPNENKCWAFLKQELKKMVDEEIEKTKFNS